MFSSTQPSGSSVTVLIGGLVWDVCGWIAGWVGQSGVQAPQGTTVVSAPGSLRHIASICVNQE